MPENSPTEIKKRFSLSSLAVYSAMASFNCDEDLEKQVEEIIQTLSTKYNSKEENCFTSFGERFVFLPGLTAGGVMLTYAIEKLIGFPPHLCLIGKNYGEINLRQIINLNAFAKKTHKKRKGILAI